VLEDEALKVAFGEVAVPWTFAIFDGRVYKYPALEREDQLTEYLSDLEKWKSVKVQFDLPQRPATKLPLKKALVPSLLSSYWQYFLYISFVAHVRKERKSLMKKKTDCFIRID